MRRILIVVCIQISVLTSSCGDGSSGGSINLLYVVDASSSQIATFKVASDGALTSENSFSVTTGPHAIVFTSDKKFAYVVSSGSNNIQVYSVSSKDGSLTSSSSSASTGTDPVSLSIAPSGKFLFVGNSSSTNISAYTIDSSIGPNSSERSWVIRSLLSAEPC